MFYLIIFLFLFIFAALEFTKIDALYKQMLFLIGVFILWFVAAFRFETGGDWTTYTQFSDEVEPLWDVLFGSSPVFSNYYMEPGYKLLNALVKSFDGGIQSVFFIMASLNALLLYLSLKRYVAAPIIGLVIYFGSLYFFLDFIALRQCLAVLIFFFSIKYIDTKNFAAYAALIILASLFHRSCLLLLPTYFIIGRKFNRKSYLVFFFCCIGIYALQIQWIKPILLVGAKLIGGTTSAIIENYVTSPVYGVSRLLSVGVFINLLLFGIYFLNFEKLAKMKYFYYFFNLFLLNIFLYFVCYELIEVGNRYRFYFLICNVVLLPSLTIIYNKVSNNVLAFLFCSMFSLFYARNILFEMSSGIAYNPYQNYILHRFLNLESTGKERLELSDKEYLKGREN